MALLSMAAPGEVAIGNDAGWALAFHKEVGGTIVETPPVLLVGRDSYYAEIEATLPQANLTGGTYRFTIEGMTDEHYARIAQAGAASQPSVVRLYLYWRDTSSSVGGYLASALGLNDVLSSFSAAELKPALVAELAITNVSRRLGERRYEAVVTAVERVLRPLANRMTGPLEQTGFRAGVLAIGTAANVSIVPYMNEEADASTAAALDQEPVKYRTGTTFRAALLDLAKKLEQASGKGGRGMLLIRDGTLHWGVRPIPLDGGEAKSLSFENGLIETEIVASVSADKNFEQTDPTAEAPARRQFKLTLKGRPDLKPGDTISFPLPPEEMGGTVAAALTAAVAGTGSVVASAAEGPGTKAYVESVVHKLGRASGFSTVLTCVELKEGEDGWDQPSAGGSRAQPDDTGSSGASSDLGERLARGMDRKATAAAAAIEVVEVGEVRKTTAAGTATAAAQTENVWEGLTDPDGKANQAARLSIRRTKPLTREGVSYATPFAWGKCGLVVPRYPGTRIVMAYRNAEASDPVDIGALWEAGKGPTTAKAGDWWLSLPAKVGPNDRDTIADSDQPPPDYSDDVSDDLIDADGRRVIQVAGMTITVGSSGLGKAGTRPDAASLAPADTLTIQHADKKASIVLKKDGEIVITGQKITIDASGDTLTLQGKGVTAKLASNAMDVT